MVACPSVTSSLPYIFIQPHPLHTMNHEILCLCLGHIPQQSAYLPASPASDGPQFISSVASSWPSHLAPHSLQSKLHRERAIFPNHMLISWLSPSKAPYFPQNLVFINVFSALDIWPCWVLWSHHAPIAPSCSSRQFCPSSFTLNYPMNYSSAGFYPYYFLFLKCAWPISWPSSFLLNIKVSA